MGRTDPRNVVIGTFITAYLVRSDDFIDVERFFILTGLRGLRIINLEDSLARFCGNGSHDREHVPACD